MKKVNLVLTLAALSTMGAVLSGCNSQDVIKIGILQPVEHEALSNAKNGFIAALAEKGFDECYVNPMPCQLPERMRRKNEVMVWE